MATHNLIDTDIISQEFGISKIHIYHQIKAGKFPKPLPAFKRPFRWKREVIEAFLLKEA